MTTTEENSRPRQTIVAYDTVELEEQSRRRQIVATFHDPENVRARQKKFEEEFSKANKDAEENSRPRQTIVAYNETVKLEENSSPREQIVAYNENVLTQQEIEALGESEKRKAKRGNDKEQSRLKQIIATFDYDENVRARQKEFADQNAKINKDNVNTSTERQKIIAYNDTVEVFDLIERVRTQQEIEMTRLKEVIEEIGKIKNDIINVSDVSHVVTIIRNATKTCVDILRDNLQLMNKYKTPLSYGGGGIVIGLVMRYVV
jgi:hypothetical protein